MPIEAGKRYAATVQRAELTESVNKGTPGIAIVFDVEDVGSIEHVIWLTPKTVERAEKDLCTLGAAKDDLKSWAYLENIGFVIQGHECDISTFEEEYNGKKRVKVQWINERKKATPSSGSLASRVASMFGGPPAPGPKQQPAPANHGIEDDDVPF